MLRGPDDVATSAENQCMQIVTTSYVIVSATANCNLSNLLRLLVPNLKLRKQDQIPHFVTATTVKCKYHERHVHICTGVCSAKYLCSAYTLTFVYCGVNIGDGTSK
jgi:hypothetical protein